MTYTRTELTPAQKANKSAVETMQRLALLETFRSAEVRKFMSHAQAEDNARKLALAAHKKAKTDRHGDPNKEALRAYTSGGGTELDTKSKFAKWLRKALKADAKGTK